MTTQNITDNCPHTSSGEDPARRSTTAEKPQSTNADSVPGDRATPINHHRAEVVYKEDVFLGPIYGGIVGGKNLTNTVFNDGSVHSVKRCAPPMHEYKGHINHDGAKGYHGRVFTGPINGGNVGGRNNTDSTYHNGRYQVATNDDCFGGDIYHEVHGGNVGGRGNTNVSYNCGAYDITQDTDADIRALEAELAMLRARKEALVRARSLRNAAASASPKWKA